MFYIGQKVVCVDDKNQTGHGYKVVKGYVYTIIGVDADHGEGCGVQLHEFPVEDDDWQFYWYAWRFRPLVERKTDIGVLTALLDPANHRELVDG